MQALDHSGRAFRSPRCSSRKYPPAQVIDAFRDVQAARIDAERAQNEAQLLPDCILGNLTRAKEAPR